MTLDTDARDVQAERALLKEQSDKMTKRNGYWSRSLTSDELEYDTTKLDFLAVD